MPAVCATVCFLFTSGSPLQASKLTFGSDSDACSVTHPCSSRNFLKAPGIHHFPSRVVKCLLRFSPLFLYGVFCRPLSCTTSLPESGLMQLFGAAACFLFASGTPLQASKLTFGSNSDACYAAFLRSLTETLRGLNSCICAQTSCFLFTSVAPLQASKLGWS